MNTFLKWIFLSVIVVLCQTTFIEAQDIGYPEALYSRAERSHYLETSLHQDVMDFVEALTENSGLAYWEIMGNSKEGREIPLVVMADPPVQTPEEARNSGKPVFYIQANIHGGEVEGKEACMILMREMAFGNLRYLLENQILLFCPIFNADGNDDLGPNNRPNQDGSPYLAGERYNGEGYDLNRDGLKCETNEGKALVENVMLRWDPLMFVDMHTTNGTWHGYAITYAPGLTTAGHPGTTNYLMQELFPDITNRVLERAGYDIFHYGSFYDYPPVVYYGMYPEPRYLTNAMALRNKLAILVETFSHDQFERRVSSNVAFLTSLFEHTHENGDDIKDLINTIEDEVVAEINDSEGDLQRGVQFGLSSQGVEEDFLVYEVYRGRRTGKRVWFKDVEIMLQYEPTKMATVPKGYVFPAELNHVASKLQEHGIEVTETEQSMSFEGEQFTVTRLNRDNRIYQGHYRANLEGYFQTNTKVFPAGSYYVDLAQPLAYMCFYLLEPEADDGLVHWNYFDDYLEDHGVNSGSALFPVFKILETGSSSIEYSTVDQEITIFPNPTDGRITISGIPDDQKGVRIEVVNSLGQQVKDIIVSNSNPPDLDLSHLGMGLYFIKVTAGQITTIRKVLFRGEE